MTLPATDSRRGATGRTRYVADLTDEEVLGIDGPGSDQVAPLPWIGDRTAEVVELAAEVGLRGLVAHGRVTAREDGLELPEDLSAALALRHDARCIVYADHSTPTTQETRILYVHPDTVLVEGVNAVGLHRFSVGGLDDALADLGEWCLPQCHDGSDRLPDEGLPAELIGLQSVVFVDVVSLTEQNGVESQSLTFYRLAEGAVVEGVESDDHLDLPPHSAAGVRRRVEQTVRQALDLA